MTSFPNSNSFLFLFLSSTMGDSSPRKRPRLFDSSPTPDVHIKPDPVDADMSDDVEVTVLENHPSLYFDDGNTILSCGSTLFCVHRSVVSKHSPVLKALCETPITRKLRGCRHIPMKDTPEDVEALLNVIYEGL